MKLKEITFGKVLKILRCASDVTEKLPNKQDAPLNWLVKGLAIAHKINDTFGKKTSSMDEYISKYDLRTLTSKTIVNLIFGSSFISQKTTKTHFLSETSSILEIIDGEERLFFTTNNLMALEKADRIDSTFYYSPGFNFKELMRILWKDYDNKIHMSAQMNYRNYNSEIHFSRLPEKEVELSPQAQARVEKYINYSGATSYMILGPAGCGKSCFARILAKQKGVRLLKIDTESLFYFVPKTMLTILEALNPDIIVIDDFDRTSGKTETSNLLLLQELFLSLGKTVILTANDISKINPAVLRAGRVNEIIDFPLPDLTERQWFLRKLILNEEDKNKIIQETEGFSQSEMDNFIVRFEERGLKSALDTCKRLHTASTPAPAPVPK